MTTFNDILNISVRFIKSNRFCTSPIKFSLHRHFTQTYLAAMCVEFNSGYPYTPCYYSLELHLKCSINSKMYNRVDQHIKCTIKWRPKTSLSKKLVEITKNIKMPKNCCNVLHLTKIRIKLFAFCFILCG